MNMILIEFLLFSDTITKIKVHVFGCISCERWRPVDGRTFARQGLDESIIRILFQDFIGNVG